MLSILIVLLIGIVAFYGGYVIGYFRGFDQAVDEYENSKEDTQ